VNQTRPYCLNQLGKTAARHGMRTAMYGWISPAILWPLTSNHPTTPPKPMF
jgi:hypothetical protein